MDKTAILMTYGSFMKQRSKVFSRAPLLPFCNTFDLHDAIMGIVNQFWSWF